MASSFIELDIDLAWLYGMGGVAYPYLKWQSYLAFVGRRPPENDYAFRTVTAQLFANNQKITDARHIVLNRIIRSQDGYLGEELLDFEFPLDQRRIETLENFRQGGSLTLRLDVQVQVEEYGVLEAKANPRGISHWGLRHLYNMALQENIVIPQSNWISQVLPSIGYGKVLLVEFPAATVESCAALSHSFKALSQAAERHKLGFYDDVAARCRIALDPFFEYIPVEPENSQSRKIPVFKQHWESKLGKATHDWLKATLGGIKGASNVSHHSPNSHFSQLDSQMILSVTTAAIAYIARSLNSEDLK
jgi:hypothetical protein